MSKSYLTHYLSTSMVWVGGMMHKIWPTFQEHSEIFICMSDCFAYYKIDTNSLQILYKFISSEAGGHDSQEAI